MELRDAVRKLQTENGQLKEDKMLLKKDNLWLHSQLDKQKTLVRNRLRAEHLHPYKDVTGSDGHEQPEMYGKVKEKTIWSYWYHKTSCASSKNCAYPAHIQLCIETVEINKGTFDYKVMHIDDVPKYVSMFELPFRWKQLDPAQQKDALMNALLARYGGVAMDISTVLLRPLDDHWNEMVDKEATAKMYMYRLNSVPWRHPEVTATWFIMSRREGIFSTAVRNQVEGMGDRNTTWNIGYHQAYFALGTRRYFPS